MEVEMSDPLPPKIKELLNLVKKSDPADVEDALPGWVRRCLLHVINKYDPEPEKSTYWNDKQDLLTQTFVESLQIGMWGDGSVLAEVLLTLLEKKSVELILSDYCETYLDAFAAVSKGIGFTNSKLSTTKLEEFLRFSKKYKTFFEKILIVNDQSKNRVASGSDVIAKRLTDRTKTGFKDTKFYWQTLSKAIVNNIDYERRNGGNVFNAIEIHILIIKLLKANNEVVMCKYKSGFEDFLSTTCNAYFLRGGDKNMEAALLEALLSFYVDLENIDRILSVAKEHGIDSLYSVYDKVIRAWLEGEAASRSLVEIVFEMSRFFSEEELELMFKSFEKLPSVVLQRCALAGLSLAHSSCAGARWLRAELLERALRTSDDNPLGLGAIKIVLECLARDETLLTASVIEMLLSSNVSLESDCPALTLTLLLHTFERHLTVQVGDSEESARRVQQCSEACAARARLPHRAARHFARCAAAALQRRLALLEYPYVEVFVNYLVELSFYLTDYFKQTTDNDTIGHIHEILFENPTDYKCSATVRTVALVKDCILGLLDCPTEIEDESLGFQREGIMRILDGNEEIYLRKKDLEIFTKNVLFRGLYLLKVVSSIDKAKAFAQGKWSPAAQKHARACADLARDFGVLHSLHELHPDSAYFSYTAPQLPFNDLLEKGEHWALRLIYKIEKESCKEFFVMVVKLLNNLANKYGYYYAYARAHTVFDVCKRLQKDFIKKEYIERTFYELSQSEFEELIQSNGYFHSIQTNAAKTISATSPTNAARAARVVAARTAALRLRRRDPHADLPDDPRHPACRSTLPDGRASDMEWEAILCHSSLLWYVYYKNRSVSWSELEFSVAVQSAANEALAALARESTFFNAKIATLALPTFRIVIATYYHYKKERDLPLELRLQTMFKLVGEVYLNILRFGAQDASSGRTADELCICEALTTDALLKLAEILAIEPDLSPLKKFRHLEVMPAELRAAGLAALRAARPALQHVAYRALDMLAPSLLQRDEYSKHRDYMGSRRGLSHPALGNREVERMAPAVEDPHPAEQVGLGFGLVDEDTYPDVVDSHVRRIYTDGSKIEGRVGAALSIWEGEAEMKAVKLALPPNCTVYQAELLALQRAVDIACKSGAVKVGVLSDSRSALQAVTLSSPHLLAVQTRAALRKDALQRREVSLFWIKSHAR
ncbi:uncharacterized protein LOC119838306 [Zerene cesonia]|uniref:uncharacterized protein LOC119838306 n=1 Tax=Zerene cesonia TaxID=33412 RepID=UPI0018E552A6|nr:uncharacterized protein LOC119838306 [Zerene cesonia]